MALGMLNGFQSVRDAIIEVPSESWEIGILPGPRDTENVHLLSLSLCYRTALTRKAGT
jgi:hypothetical protein